MLNRLLFTKTDNLPLLIFSAFFGVIIVLESYGAIATGWIKETQINPKVDLAHEKWDHIKHHEWIFPSDLTEQNHH